MTIDTRLLLVIDDDELDRKRLIRWLGQQYAICEASTGRVGVDMARRMRPGCVLLDYQLTDSTGLDVLEELTRSDLSVVLLTGRGDEQVATSALKNGAVDYLVKDKVTREELGHAIGRGLLRSAARGRADQAGRELRGFEELADSILRPRLGDASRACQEALRVHPDLDHVLGRTMQWLAEVDEHVRGLSWFARVDGLCAVVDEVDLADVAREVEQRLREDETTRVVELEIRGLPIVRGAQQGLEVLLFELLRAALRNALVAEEPRVTLAGDLVGGLWQIRVEDNGAPPSEEELSRDVFLPYRRGVGRDLAFALAAQIVRRHGGEIWIEGAEPAGCAVTFSLPFTH